MDVELSIIIVNYNSWNLLQRCLESVLTHVHIDAFEVIVVDNNSARDETDHFQALFPSVRFIRSEKNLGFGCGSNLGVHYARGRYFLFLNPDTKLMSDTPQALLDYCKKHPAVGAAGPGVKLEDGRDQPNLFGYQPGIWTLFNESFGLNRLFKSSPIFRGINGLMADHSEKELKVGWISGVCMLVPRAAFEDVGGFNSSFFLYAEDIEFCKRLLEKGWDVVHLNDFHIVHHLGGCSMDLESTVRNGLFYQKNLLKILEEKYGPWQLAVCRLIIATGLLGRLLIWTFGSFIGRRHLRLKARIAVSKLKHLFE